MFNIYSEYTWYKQWILSILMAIQWQQKEIYAFVQEAILKSRRWLISGIRTTFLLTGQLLLVIIGKWIGTWNKHSSEAFSVGGDTRHWSKCSLIPLSTTWDLQTGHFFFLVLLWQFEDESEPYEGVTGGGGILTLKSTFCSKPYKRQINTNTTMYICDRYSNLLSD